jgi:multiple sugar transport system permease protein
MVVGFSISNRGKQMGTKKSLTMGRYDKWWIWILPLVFVLLVFYLYPILNIFQLSFTDTRIGGTDFSYTFSSYVSVLTDETFWRVLYITLIFVVFSVFFQLFLGLCTALLINQNLPGAGLVKLSMVFAWVVPGIITGIMWQMIYSSSGWGIINYFVKKLGFQAIPFLAEPSLAIGAAIVANIWRGTGFSGIMQYAALSNIPGELYDSGKMDGAGSFQCFWRITLPLLKPMLMINVILITIYTFNTYDSVYALTRGGPGSSTTVISLQAYKAVFTFLSLGNGSVYAIIMMVLSIIFTLLYMRMMDSKD